MTKESQFDERAKSWDKPGQVAIASAFTRAVKEKIKPDAAVSAMDYGAGTGLVTMELAGTVQKITAMDNSTGMLEVLEEKIKKAGVENVTTLLFDIEKDNLPGETFDLIVSSMALHHIKDTESTLRKFYKSLSEGGKLAIADLDKEDGDFHPENVIIEHKGFDQDMLIDLCKKAGFRNVETEIIFSIKDRDSGRGVKKDYDIFLLTAVK